MGVALALVDLAALTLHQKDLTALARALTAQLQSVSGNGEWSRVRRCREHRGWGHTACGQKTSQGLCNTRMPMLNINPLLRFPT